MNHTILKLLVAATSIIPFKSLAGAKEDTLSAKSHIGRAYELMYSLPDSSLYHGREALRLSMKTRFFKGLIQAYNVLGTAYWVKGEYPAALSYFSTILTVAEARGDEAMIAGTCGNLAAVYVDLGDFPRALAYEKKTLALMRRLHDENGIALNTNTLGIIYDNQNMPDTAIFYYRQAYDMFQRAGSTRWLPLILSNMSSVYTQLLAPDKAIAAAHAALGMPDSSLDYKTRGHIFLSLSKAYALKKDHSTAIAYAEKAMSAARPGGVKEILRDASEQLYLNYDAIGNYKAALDWFRSLTLYRDSMINADNFKTVNNLNTRLFVEKKNRELQRTKARLSASEFTRQKEALYLVIAIILILFIGIVSFLLHNRQRLLIAAQIQQIKGREKETALIKLDLKCRELENSDLRQEVEFKKKELLTFTLSLAQKNQFLSEIKAKIQALNSGCDPDALRDIKASISFALDSEQNWEEFRIRFEQVHQLFFQKLKESFPQLTPNDERLCAFIKLNLSSKQIASLLNIAASSVDISKHRLKKKLNLDADANLSEFIYKLHNS